MKNFEKYEKEIKTYGYGFAITKDKMILPCGEVNCDNCILLEKYGKTCNSARLNWLYEEYKEPLLTEEEKEYLKVVIKPFRKYISYIYHNGVHLNIRLLKPSYFDYIISLPFENEFRGLGKEKTYTLEELEL